MPNNNSGNKRPPPLPEHDPELIERVQMPDDKSSDKKKPPPPPPEHDPKLIVNVNRIEQSPKKRDKWEDSDAR